MRFKKLYIEITNVCNLACSFCPETCRKPEIMTIEAFEHILKEIEGYSEHIYLHVKGEPLLHPSIGDFLTLAQSYGYKVNLTTNGTLIKNASDKLLSKAALRQVNFSLHSFDGNEGVGSLEQYLQQIFDFTDKVLEGGNTIIAYRLWNNQGNEASNVESKNKKIVAAIQEHFNISFDIEEKIMKSGGIKLKDRLYLNQDFEFVWPELDLCESDEKGFCYGLRSHAAILVDGTVVPCCLDGEGVINLGNIKEHSFGEILNSDRAVKIFEGFSQRKVVEELCKKCDYRRKFQVK